MLFLERIASIDTYPCSVAVWPASGRRQGVINPYIFSYTYNIIQSKDGIYTNNIYTPPERERAKQPTQKQSISSTGSHSANSSIGIRSFNHPKTASVPFSTICHLGTLNRFPETSNRLSGEPPPQFSLTPSALSSPIFGGNVSMSLFDTSRTWRPWTAVKSRFVRRLAVARRVVRFG